MQATIWDAALREELVRRIESVPASARARWGKLNAEQMLAHLGASARLATGELTASPKRTPFKFGPIRRLIIYKLPFPKGAPTAPEMLPPVSRDVSEAKRDITALLEQIVSRPRDGAWPEHPAFGRLDGDDWGVLMYRHFDHHLRQFGA